MNSKQRRKDRQRSPASKGAAGGASTEAQPSAAAHALSAQACTSRGESQLTSGEDVRWATTDAEGVTCDDTSCETTKVRSQTMSPVFMNPVQPPLSEGVPYGVLLRGLPNELCTELMMQVVLQQAGLTGNYFDFRIEQGDICGEVFFTLNTQSSAEYAVWHFEGCQWGDVPFPVSAHMVEVACGQLSYEDEMDYMYPCQNKVGDNLIEAVLTALLEPSDFNTMTCQSMMHEVAPPLFLPALQPAMICDIPRPQTLTEPVEDVCASTAASKPALWEKCSDQVTVEASTDAGTSEISDDHDGEDGCD